MILVSRVKTSACSSVPSKQDIQEIYRSLGLVFKKTGTKNIIDIARICDIVMNPETIVGNSRDLNRKRSIKLLIANKTILPLTDFFLYEEQNSILEITNLIQRYPPMMCSSAAQMVMLYELCRKLGVGQPITILRIRPRLTGIVRKQNFLKILEWMSQNRYNQEQIVSHLRTSV